MRNTGAAIGIAYMTTMLVDHEQIHQSRLTEHLSIFDAWKLSERAPSVPGAPTFHYLPQMISGQHQAFGIIYNSARISLSERARELATLRAEGLLTDEEFATAKARVLGTVPAAGYDSGYEKRNAPERGSAMTANY